MDNPEQLACTPEPLSNGQFNPSCILPYKLTLDDIQTAMSEFLSFLEYLNTQLFNRGLPRLESFFMPANFSSLVGEFMVTAIPKTNAQLVKNRYHNGHPDLIPVDVYPENAVLHGEFGIEIKSSRHITGWQGHNAEDVWLMIFVFDSNSQNDMNPIRPFRFRFVAGASISKSDWSESGRTGTSRRTPTASILTSGRAKMTQNWIYKANSQNGIDT